MKAEKILLFLLLPFLTACGSRQEHAQKVPKTETQAGIAAQYPKTLFTSEALQVQQISEHAYVHISYLSTNDFGKVACNGMIVVNGDKAIVFDATTKDSTSKVLIQWIRSELKANPVALVATHFHEDCLGGAKAFRAGAIPTYAGNKTIAMTKEKHLFVPEHGFDSSHIFTINGEEVIARYFGGGHTKDNTIGYFAKDAVLFGGCLVKELEADKGYLGDADEAAWPATIVRVKQAYPDVKLVIPGHGAIGGKALLDYTEQLFTPKESK